MPSPVAAASLVECGSDAELWRHLLGRLHQLGRQLGLPGGYRHCGVSEQAYAALLPVLIQEALASGSTRLAPLVPDAAGFERMFWQAFHGEAA